MPSRPRRAVPLRQRVFGRGRLSFVFRILWAAFVVCTAFGAIFNGQDLLDARLSPSELQPAKFDFALDLWSCLAALFFGHVVVPNRFMWGNGTRFAVGGLAFAAMIGRIASEGVIAWAIGGAPISLSVWLVIAPILLAFAGFLVIVGLGVPVAIFNQIFAFEQALTIYQYEARGLAGYIVRCMLWLRNETLPPGPPDESKGARLATFDEICRLGRRHKVPGRGTQCFPSDLIFGKLGVVALDYRRAPYNETSRKAGCGKSARPV